MIPYSYNMVDMGGIDLAEANGIVVPGVYEKIVEAMNLCGDLILYNWKFAGISIAPSAYAVLQQVDSILINGLIQVTAQDVVTVLGIAPPIVPVGPLSVTENGVYTATPPASGFNPVTVSVEGPTLIPLDVVANGDYSPADYNADGFSAVSVEVPIPAGGKYQEVEPDFFGLATAYQSLDASFWTNPDNSPCLFFAKIHAGEKYLVFLPETYSNRFRAARWPGKSFSDFEPYLNSPGTNIQIYDGAIMITPNLVDLAVDGLTRRFFFDGVDGEVLIGTSNVSEIIKPILLKIDEVQ